jgi:hypothetical protein
MGPPKAISKTGFFLLAFGISIALTIAVGVTCGVLGSMWGIWTSTDFDRISPRPIGTIRR